MDPMPDVGYVLTPDGREEWRTIKGKWQKVEPVNGGRKAMSEETNPIIIDGLGFLLSAANSLTSALGALIIARKDHPGIHKRLVTLAEEADTLYLDALEAMNVDEDTVEPK